MTTPVKVLIVDEHTLFREGLSRLLQTHEQIQVVGQASSAAQALEEVDRLSPNVVTMDIQMPGMDGLEAASLIKERHPEISVIVLTMHQNVDFVLRSIKAGASGYVQKDAPAERLIETILRTRYDPAPLFNLAVDPAVLLRMAEKGPIARGRGLSEQERRILQLAADGHTNKQIAETLFLAEQTVKGYIHNILRKLDSADRTQAVAIALREGLVR